MVDTCIAYIIAKKNNNLLFFYNILKRVLCLCKYINGRTDETHQQQKITF
jgi:hypothetical protein